MQINPVSQQTNFKGTFHVSTRVDNIEHTDRALRAVRRILKQHNPSSITRAKQNLNNITSEIKASFDASQDQSVISALLKLREKVGGIVDFNYTTFANNEPLYWLKRLSLPTVYKP